MESWFFCDWLTYAAVIKAISTFLKYFMQVLHNYQLKEVRGQSMFGQWWDFTACVCGMTALHIDSWEQGYTFLWQDPHLNFAKVVLILIAMSFDLIILSQYYFVYPPRSHAKSFEMPLLPTN